MAHFSVDTHLFRELGKLLVGRDSTALVELIKNAYDADATEVTVYGELLHQPDSGSIIIKDDGNGMTHEQFTDGFLPSPPFRLKDEGERRSERFKRRFTGAKGVGRLAAHKLATLLRVTSIPRISGEQGIDAMIDWDVVEQYQTLDQLEGKGAIISRIPNPRGTPAGTTIRLERLREKWARHRAFVSSKRSPAFNRRRWLLISISLLVDRFYPSCSRET